MQKVNVPVQFGGGINTKTDPKQLQAGQLLTLQNGQFSKTGQINKRYGYNVLNTTIEGGGTITQGVELATYKNELILFDGNNIYSYLQATGNWANRGTAISITTLDKAIIRLSAAQQLNPDMNYLNGVEAYAWEDSRGGVRYATMDAVTRAFPVHDILVNGNGQQPKIVAFNSLLWLFYTDGANTIYYQTINPLNPTIIAPAVAITTDGYAGLNGFPYDVTVANGNLYVAYLSDSTNTGAIQAFYIDGTNTKRTTLVIDNTPGLDINDGYHGCINIAPDSLTNLYVSWGNGLSVQTCRANSTLGQVTAVFQVDTTNTPVITAISSNSSGQMILCYEVYNSVGYNEQVRYTTLTPEQSFVPFPHTDINVGSINTIRSVGLASKAFTFNNNIYVNTAYQSYLQATDFTFLLSKNGTILTTPVIVAKETPGVGGGLQTNGMCPETPALSGGVFQFANLEAGPIVSEGNTLFTILGVNSTQLTFTPSDNFVNTTQANTLLIVGGILQGYDGVSTTETGFHIYPENVVAAAGGSGSLSTGTYQYQVEFEWTDNNGQIYRSAPCVPVSVQVTAGQQVILSGPTLRLTAKTTPISIVIYRTAANGTTFNRVTSTLSPLLNNSAVDTWYYTDTLSDLSAQSNELIYTTGGVLANIAPPANSIVQTYGDRVFLAGLSDPLLMWYSQTVLNNTNANTVPPQFCAELTFGLDPRGGNITALGLLNQILVIFKQNNIFALQGNGPDGTGNNNDYGDATLITSDVGCVNDNSVVIMPQGLMFQSAKGIYLLDQNTNLTYIGAPVEAFNNLTITSAVLNDTANQVIFTTSNGTALVYDYFMQQWSTWTNHYAQDSVIYNNVFCYINAAGQVYMQNQNVFTDNGAPVLMSWTLPNLAFAGLQGYQRVFRMFILGSYKGPHTLNVSVAYDYNDSYSQFCTVTPSSNVSTWGSDSNWGSGPLWGGTYQLYEFRVDFAIQKCTAIRVMVSDNQTSNYNEGYSISSVIFVAGVLPGGNRLPTSSTFGT